MACGGEPQLDLVMYYLCFEVYNSTTKVPKGLPCMHTFCLECLGKFVKDKLDFKLPCPLCQAKLTLPEGGVLAIPTNILVNTLLENMKKTAHMQLDVSSHAKCQEHNKGNCEVVCKVCHVPLCVICIVNLKK